MNSRIGRLAQYCHVISAWWMLMLAFLIFIDVIGRSFFNAPLTGTSEIIKNSIVSITFLQLPLAIYRGGMIRAGVIFSAVGPKRRQSLRIFGTLLGLIFFAAIAYISWEPALQGLAVREYEGEGSLRVPTWPLRFVVVTMSAACAGTYFYLLALDLSGQGENEDGEIVGS